MYLRREPVRPRWRHHFWHHSAVLIAFSRESTMKRTQTKNFNYSTFCCQQRTYSRSLVVTQGWDGGRGTERLNIADLLNSADCGWVDTHLIFAHKLFKNDLFMKKKNNISARSKHKSPHDVTETGMINVQEAGTLSCCRFAQWTQDNVVQVYKSLKNVSLCKSSASLLTQAIIGIWELEFCAQQLLWLSDQLRCFQSLYKSKEVFHALKNTINHMICCITCD